MHQNLWSGKRVPFRQALHSITGQGMVFIWLCLKLNHKTIEKELTLAHVGLLWVQRFKMSYFPTSKRQMCRSLSTPSTQSLGIWVWQRNTEKLKTCNLFHLSFVVKDTTVFCPFYTKDSSHVWLLHSSQTPFLKGASKFEANLALGLWTNMVC